MSGVKLTQAVTAVTPLDDALREPVRRRRAPAKAVPKPIVGTSYVCRCGYRTDDQGCYQAHLRAEIDDLKSELMEFRDGLPRRSDGRRLIAVCGTLSAYERHVKLGEEVCVDCREATRIYRQDPRVRERRRQQQQDYRARDREDPEVWERRMARQRESQRRRRAANPEAAKAYQREWRAAHPEAVNAINARRRERHARKNAEQTGRP